MMPLTNRQDIEGKARRPTRHVMNGRVNRVRWCIKKGSRLALASLACGWLKLGDRSGHRPRVRVLTYHRFGEMRRDPFRVRVKEFERQMAWISEHHLAISLANVQAFLAGDEVLADGSVLITVDDGCPSLFTRALPILQHYRIPAVAFIPAGEISNRDGRQSRPSGETSDARITWAELTALAEAGVVVGSHAWTHRSLGRMSMREVREQAERSREALERHIGRPVTAFAYPFGTHADYSETTATVLRESGYTCAFTSQHGAVRTGMDPFTLPRVKVEGGEPLWMFRLLCRGGLDAWRWIDRTLWRLQAGERIRGRQGLTGSRMVG
jgi:peptidoglycan/xylan/chitin deacetylase (PgdA/CDA1 family)